MTALPRTAARGEPALTEVAPGVHAYLQRGGWGFSNAGLVADGDASLLIDTLYDLATTERMLVEMRRRLPAAARIDTVVNTHANGDHCWGNQLVAGASIVSSRAAADEMRALPPRLMVGLVEGAARVARLGGGVRRILGLLGRIGVPYVGPLSEAAEFVGECFGAFDFRGIRLTLPTRTFEGRLSLTVGGKAVELIQVGPAHTKGDLLVHLPADRVVFTGDILFVGSHPIVWEGPIANWMAACDRILELDAAVIVPGHGPITTAEGVQATKAYWQSILQAARRGREAGATPDDVARDLLASGFVDWSEGHRLVVNVDTAYRDLSGDRSRRDPLALFARMSRIGKS